MKWRTEIEAFKYPFQIHHKSKVFSIGSCFSQEMGVFLDQRGFDALINPFGTIFNPISISSLLQFRPLDQASFVKREQRYVSLMLHSKINSTSKEGLGAMIADLQCSTKSSFEAADVVIITLGSSYVYSLKESGQVVASCHKQPSKLFAKKSLSVDDIIDSMNSVLANNRDKKFIFTISPVRHSKEGLVNNNLSKSLLRVALGQITVSFDNAYYFPAYEIVNDDLRDYRFYEKDLIHPNEQAKDYIWSVFEKSFFSEKTINLSKKYLNLQLLMNHRVLDHNNRAAHQNKIDKLKTFLEVELSKIV